MRARQDQRERIRILPCPGVPGLELLWAARVTRAFPRHAHSGQLLGLIDQGGRRFKLRHGDVELGPGALFGLGPDTPHACEPLGAAPHDYRALRFNAESLSALGLEAPVLMPSAPQRLELADRVLARGLRTVFALADELLFSPADSANLDLPGELRARLAELLERAGRMTSAESLPQERAVSAPHPLVARAQEFIQRRFDQAFTLEELGQACGCSPFHLHRLFVREVGLSPLECQVRLRILAVRRLLEAGETPLQAALSAGFFDQSHCARHFKRVLGVGPAAFRRTPRK